MCNVRKETLDEIVKRIDDNVKEIRTQTTETNGRVGELENWKSKITGAVIVLSAILTPVVYFVADYLLAKGG